MERESWKKFATQKKKFRKVYLFCRKAIKPCNYGRCKETNRSVNR